MTEAVAFRRVDHKRADDLFSAPLREQKWAEVTTSLLKGESVFIADMSRVALESLRSITNRRHYGRLHSRQMVVDGEQGRLLRLDRKAQT